MIEEFDMEPLVVNLLPPRNAPAKKGFLKDLNVENISEDNLRHMLMIYQNLQ